MTHDSNTSAGDPTLETEPLTEELTDAVLPSRARDTLPCPPPDGMDFDLDWDPDEDEELVA